MIQSRAMRIAIGADHAGFALKEHLKNTLSRLGHQVEDLGTHSDAPVDYPPICAAVGRMVSEGRADRGIVLGGSGQGEQIAANKIPGIRAALCNDLLTARLARQHNDANILSMGGRIVAPARADEILSVWLDTAFEGGRHQRRIDQITELESSMSTKSEVRRQK
jgi:ribose 5-phosphate isomerase B